MPAIRNEVEMNDSRTSSFVAAVGFAVVAIASVLGTPPAWPQGSSKAGTEFSDWSAPVNLGPVVNSTFNESTPTVSRKGLSLYFDSNRPGGVGGSDIWVSQRDSVEESWGPPINLGAVINSTADDVQANLSRDGHWLYFVSRRPGLGGFDIWRSYREQVHDDFAWQPPVTAGPAVNTVGFDQNPFFFENDDLTAAQLFFTKGLPSDIYVSTLLPDGTFGPALPVPVLNSTANDRGLSIRFEGLEVFLMSTRSGGVGAQDLWTATRQTVFDPWSAPINLGPLVNSAAGEFDPFIASDRQTLYFMSNRADGVGGQDLYVATRTKQKP
jgi:hypothetical protein